MNITVSEFKGIAPKVNPRLLDAKYAQISTNLKYDSGSLQPVKSFTNVEYVADGANVKSIYKYTGAVNLDTWLYFADTVDVVKDPINSYPDNRLIFTGLDVPRVCDNAHVTDSPYITEDNSFILGLPVPTAPVIAVGSIGDEYYESRAYTVQYDRVWADGKIDQGAVSYPAAAGDGSYFVDVTTNGSVIISNIEDAPAGYGITHITINRSGTATTDSSFHYVSTFNIQDAKDGDLDWVEWDPVTKTFTVTDSVETSDLGMACINQLYVGPNATMKGLVATAGGMLAGFYDNTVCFSEPFQPHAWPDAYTITVASKIVGLGSFGDIVVVCTEDTPYIIQVTDPSAMVAFPLKDFVPCVSARSIVSYRDCVVYPSEVGIIKIDRTGTYNLTQSIASIDDMKTFGLNNVKAEGLGSYFYMVYTDTNGQNKMLSFNIVEPETGFGICDYSVIDIYSDFSSVTLYALYRDTSGVYSIGSYDTGSANLVYKWRSKIFVLPYRDINLSGARLNLDASMLDDSPIVYDPANTKAYGYNVQGYNEVGYNGFARAASANYVMFTLYVDGELMYSKVVTNSRPFRLPAGYVGREVEIALTGNVPVYSIDLATSFSELS